ncbi:AbrB/MazE/SpoVT family DNA-binding domain-containing protein [Candidatus Woesearchaeota archaeon]|nr:AbrB/MazE/SpoVT family DNA-binding domain-containing protein [Candidatus Woesearchaeota archaeon]
MAMTVQYARKVGGSLMVRIPKDIVEIEQIDEGETLQVEIRKLKKDCFGILSGLKPFTKTEKLDIHG